MAQSDGSLPKGQHQRLMYSDYLWAVKEAEKEEAMEPSHSQTADSTSKPKVMSFFPSMKAERHPACQDLCCMGGALGRREH